MYYSLDSILTCREVTRPWALCTHLILALGLSGSGVHDTDVHFLPTCSTADDSLFFSIFP